MITEADLIPYQTAELPPGPWLVFAPHPDDESFGMGGSISLATAAGIAVDLVIMTDGALGGNREGLVRIREEEARRASAVLGVRELHFLRRPDRGLMPDDEGLVMGLVALIEERMPAAVFFPGIMEPHPDHRVTTALVWQTLQQANSTSIEVFSYEISVQGAVNRLIDITAAIPRKKKALACYGSQLGENNYAEIVLALNKARTFTLTQDVLFAEGFYHFSNQEKAWSLQEVFTALLQKQFFGQ